MLLEMSVQECVGHVQLLGGPATACCDSEHCVDGRRFIDDWSEGFIEVNASTLSESAHDPSSFVSFQRSIGIKLVFENPFAGYDIGAGWAIDQAPGSVALERIKLGGHGVAPVGILQSGSSCGGYR